jgi:30S ribosomal protein S31
VGKGDRRTRRGKIYAGSFGKSRPKDPKAKTKVIKPRSSVSKSVSSAKPAAKVAPRRKPQG